MNVDLLSIHKEQNSVKFNKNAKVFFVLENGIICGMVAIYPSICTMIYQSLAPH